MGWTFTYKAKGQDLTEWFINQGVLRWNEDSPYTYRVLDAALVKVSEYYAAVEQIHKETGERRVWAAMILVRFVAKDPSYNFGYKDMDESMGPCYYNCPERILDLLTETEYPHAKAWREHCRRTIAENKAKHGMRPGDILVYGGREYQVVKPIGRMGYQVMGPGGLTYRMSRPQIRASTLKRAAA